MFLWRGPLRGFTVYVTCSDRLQRYMNCDISTLNYLHFKLTHWGRVTHICVSELTINGSDNGLSPGRRQAIIWTNAGILLIGAFGTNVSEILIKICTFSLKKMLLKMSSGNRRPSCLGLNVLRKGNAVPTQSRDNHTVVTCNVSNVWLIWSYGETTPSAWRNSLVPGKSRCLSFPNPKHYYW